MTEAELLFTHILGYNRLGLYLNKGMYLEQSKSQEVSAVLKRRILGEPLQYILGRTEFMGLEFRVNPSVLIPRQETEILAEEVIKLAVSCQLSANSLKILDLGTGSGCIAVSLAKFLPDFKITAVDISLKALKTARENAVLNNVADKIDFVEGDLFQHRKVYNILPKSPPDLLRKSKRLGLRKSPTNRRYLPAGRQEKLSPKAFFLDYGQGQGLPLSLLDYDLIVSNPPYIPTGMIDNLQTEIKYEPLTALDAGKDGLDFYRRIIREAPDYLKENGLLIMEMGFNQADEIKNIFRDSGKFEVIRIIKDYSGIERVVVAKSVNRKAKSAELKCKT